MAAPLINTGKYRHLHLAEPQPPEVRLSNSGNSEIFCFVMQVNFIRLGHSMRMVFDSNLTMVFELKLANFSFENKFKKWCSN